MPSKFLCRREEERAASGEEEQSGRLGSSGKKTLLEKGSGSQNVNKNTDPQTWAGRETTECYGIEAGLFFVFCFCLVLITKLCEDESQETAHPVGWGENKDTGPFPPRGS